MEKWLFFAVASSLFAALTAVLGKIGVSGINSNFATTFRTLVVLLMSAMIVTARQEWIRPTEIPFRSLIFLTLSGFATGASWLCYYRALQLGPASKVAPIDKISVIFTVILSVLILGEQMSFKLVAGTLLMVAGSLLIAFA